MEQSETAGKHSVNQKNSIREHEEKLKALLHGLPVGISILNSERMPIYTNPALEKTLGLSNVELWEGKYKQRKYMRADGSQMPASEFPSTRAFETGRAVRDVEIGVVKEDGSLIWITVNAVHLGYGDWQVVLTVVDVTDRKQAADALQVQAVELLDRVKKLNCLYSIADLVERPKITLGEILQGTVDLIPAAWPEPQATRSRIVFETNEFVSSGGKSASTVQSREILVHGKVEGALEVYVDAGLQSDRAEEMNLLSAIAERLGRIIERFQAEEKLVKLATTDPLTGVYNRRHFFSLAEIEVERSQRYGRPLACIMFDIDYFKNINDSHGHLFGDRVLQEMVRRCRAIIRRVDVFARYGGDEFVILLPETGIKRARYLANRLRDHLKMESLQIEGQNTSITLSMGVASMDGDGDLMLDALLNRADQALYLSKGKGRNQVSIWLEEV